MPDKPFMRNSICLEYILATSLVSLLSIPVEAQVVPDTSLGNTNSTVIPNQLINGVPSDTVSGGAIRDSTLFHSFQKFNIPDGRGVYFINPAGVTNILTRVTGSSPSNLLGTLGVLGNANLFFLNPNGIVFGPNVRLDINGSFLGTTATEFSFPNGSTFSATHPQNAPLLTVNIPIGLNFTGNSGPIEVQGNGYIVSNVLASQQIFTPQAGISTTGLRVQPQNTLALIGGNVTFNGGIATAPSGTIEIGSIGSGQVMVNPFSQGWKFDYSGVRDFQNIQLDNLSLLDGSGFGGGSISLYGSQINLSNGSFVFLQTQGDRPAGEIVVNAVESLIITGRVSQPSPDVLYSAFQDAGLQNRAGITSQNLSGQGSNIFISTKDLIIQSAGGIANEAPFQDSSGNISINASNSVQVIGFSPIKPPIIFSVISIRSSGSANAGDISINTNNLSIIDGGYISSSTLGYGTGGAVTVNANQSILVKGFNPSIFTPSFLASNTYGTGDANRLSITTPKLAILNGGVVAAATLTSGSAGPVTINASDSITVDGTNPGSNIPSSIGSAATFSPLILPLLGVTQLPSTNLDVTGNTRSVEVNTKQLNVTNGAQITVTNEGKGKGGILTINAPSIFLNNGGKLLSTTASANGGNIFINSQDLQLRHNSIVSANGNINGNGGNVTLNTDTLVALENSGITADALRGNGGNIQINTQQNFRSSDSIYTASSKFGISRPVQFNTPAELNFARASSTPTTPPQSPQVTAVCPTRAGSTESRLVNSGTGGTAPTTNSMLNGDTIWQDNFIPTYKNQTAKPKKHSTKQPVRIILVTGLQFFPDGTASFTAGNLDYSPSTPSGCSEASSNK